MAELTSKRRRHAAETAEAVALIAASSSDPFIKKELYRAVNAIRKHFGYTAAEKEAEVLRRIKIGASTVNDLIRETGFPQQDIWDITKRLESAKLIELQRLSVSGNGRPGCLFIATGAQA